MKNVTKCKAYPIPQPSDPRSGHAHYAAGCLFRFCFCLRQNENCHIKHTHTPHMPHAAPCCRSATWVIFIFNMKMHAKREQKRGRETVSRLVGLLCSSCFTWLHSSAATLCMCECGKSEVWSCMQHAALQHCTAALRFSGHAQFVSRYTYWDTTDSDM